MKQLRIHRGQTVDVFMDGATIRGRLAEATSDGVVLHEAHARSGLEGRSVDLAGPAHVPTHSIVWVQVVVK